MSNALPKVRHLQQQHLLAVLDHPTQYDPPLWAALSRGGEVVPTVWYAFDGELHDAEAGVNIQWRVPKEAATLVADGQLARRIALLDPKPNAILTGGWTKARTWRTVHAARRFSIPLILPTDKTFNEPSPSEPKRAAINLMHALRCRLFDAFFTTGRLGSEALRAFGIPHERIATGLYPIDVAWWQQRVAELRSRSVEVRKTLRGTFVVLAVSKLSQRENPWIVLEGFHQFRKAHEGARLLYVGDGPLKREVEGRVRELGLTEHTRFVGYVPYTDLATFYGAADVFVHVPEAEPWGISVGEAMACGLPVISSTAVGSAADLVITGRTGFLIPPRDPRSLADALRVASEAGRSAQLGRQARARVTILDVNTVAAGLASLLHRLPEPIGQESIRDVLRSSLLNKGGLWP